MDLNDDFVRVFLNECILQTEDYELALNVFRDPKSDSEIITALNAAKQSNNKLKMKELIAKAEPFSKTNHLINELVNIILALIK